MTYDPHQIGQVKAPAEAPDRYLKDTDQRGFSSVQNLYPSTGDVWDGGDPPEVSVRRVVARYLRRSP